MERVLHGAAPPAFVRALWRRVAAAPGRVILGLGLLLALVLAAPGETVATRFLEDLFATLDGVQRLAAGQVPHRDFHSAFGPLTYYIPGLGYWLTGSLGAALPLGMALVTLVVTTALAHILPSRLAPGLALPFGFFLLVILAVPMNLGDSVTALSFNQFYNRIGWVALAGLLVLYLPPRDERQSRAWADTACAAVLTLLMVYTRATYALVAIAFLALMLIDRRQWRWAVMALASVALVIGGAELFWRGSSAYLGDVLLAFAAGGLLRGTPVQMLDLFLGNLAEYLLLGLITGLLFWRRFRIRDLVFVLFCSACGFWLLNQNDQRWGIIAMHAAAVVVAERILRDMARPDARPAGPVVNPAGVQLYLLGLIFPTIVHCCIALGLHAGTASINGGQPVGLARLDAVRLANLWTPGDFGGARWYLELAADGLAALEAAGAPPGRIVVLGGPDPYSIALDLPPATGDVAQLRWGATHNRDHFIPPDEFLADADTVMERVAAGGIGGERDLGPVYLPYVRANFDLVAESRDWRIYRRSTGEGTATP